VRGTGHDEEGDLGGTAEQTHARKAKRIQWRASPAFTPAEMRASPPRKTKLETLIISMEGFGSG
jgi:hypothetical protein